MTETQTHELKPLFEPASVAVIGASNNPKPGFGPPRFATAAFAVKDRRCAIEVTVFYP